MKDDKKEVCSPRTNRKYPVALRHELKLLSVKVNVSMEDLEIYFIRHGIENVEAILKEHKK